MTDMPEVIYVDKNGYQRFSKTITENSNIKYIRADTMEAKSADRENIDDAIDILEGRNEVLTSQICDSRGLSYGTILENVILKSLYFYKSSLQSPPSELLDKLESTLEKIGICIDVETVHKAVDEALQLVENHRGKQ